MTHDEMVASYGLEYAVRELEKRITALEQAATEPEPPPAASAAAETEGEE